MAIYKKNKKDGSLVRVAIGKVLTDSTLSGNGTSDSNLKINTSSMTSGKQYSMTTDGWKEISATGSQKSYKTVKVGGVSVEALAGEDTLNLSAGSNVTLSADASSKTVTISADGEKYSAGSGINISDANVVSVDTTTIASVSALASKVDKVDGKGLSTNDYTTAEQTKLAGIESGAEENTIDAITVNGAAVAVSGKTAAITVPTYSEGTGIDFSSTGVISVDATIATVDQVNKKVDSVDGKGLSTNDYTDTDQAKLAGIESGAEVNVIDAITVNGTAVPVAGKNALITVPSYSEGTGIDISDAGVISTDSTIATVSQLSTKVDAVAGKGLSTNDYTTAEQSKLAGIADGAEANTINAITVNGSAVSITDKTAAITVPSYSEGTGIDISSTGVISVDSSIATVDALSKKVDAVEGKGLSTNDYTTADQTKLSGISEGAEANKIDAITVNGSAVAVTDKTAAITVPSYSEGTGIDISSSGVISVDSTIATVDALSKKVDAVEGKGLSTNDYTTADQAKLSGISAGAEANKIDAITVNGAAVAITDKTAAITVPTYSEGTGIDIYSNGVISVDSTVATVDALNKKVDTVEGKGLSTNDYTTADQTKLSGIESGAEANKIDAITVNGSAVAITDKTAAITVPTYSEGTGIDITTAGVISVDATIATVDALSKKVDAVEGKGLSTNDYTSADQAKLSGIAEGAEANKIDSIVVNGSVVPVTDKIATITVPSYSEGTGIDISSAGVISVDSTIATVSQLSTKVDSVEGKGLSTNDYTTAEQTKLSGIAEGAEANKIDAITVNGSAVAVTDKTAAITVPTYSEGTGIDISSTGVISVDSTVATTDDLSKKVDTVTGKGLSTNDYTTAEQTKLSGIAEGAEVNKIDAITVNGAAVAITDKTAAITVQTYSEGTGIDFSSTGVISVDSTIATVEAMNKKVDAVEGKGLSTNDYTTAEQAKLSGIAEGAEVNKIDTITVNGTAVEITDKTAAITVQTYSDGTGIDISSDGEISVDDTIATVESLNTEIENRTTADTSILANISDTFDTTKTYAKGDIVFYNGVLYKANEEVAAGSWDATKWIQTTVEKEIDTKVNVSDQVVIAGTGYQSIIEGDLTSNNASMHYAHAEGTRTNATAFYSHAENYSTTASGAASHAEGYDTTASGDYSHTEGTQTKATASNAHAEGMSSTASGKTSHAEGESSEASGQASHAEGLSYASGKYSHSEGEITYAIGIGSHAEGFRTYANDDYSHVSGKYSVKDATGAEIVGGGTSGSNTKNIRVLDWDGNETIAGKHYGDGNTISLEEQISDNATEIVNETTRATTIETNLQTDLDSKVSFSSTDTLKVTNIRVVTSVDDVGTAENTMWVVVKAVEE